MKTRLRRLLEMQKGDQPRGEQEAQDFTRFQTQLEVPPFGREAHLVFPPDGVVEPPVTNPSETVPASAAGQELVGWLTRSLREQILPRGRVAKSQEFSFDNRLVVNELFAGFSIAWPGPPVSPRTFFVAAGEAMRSEVVQSARAAQERLSTGTGSDVATVATTETSASTLGGAGANPEAVFARDARCTQLKDESADMYELLILRMYAGRTVDEIASLVHLPADQAKAGVDFALMSLA